MRIELIEDLEALPALRAEWEDVLSKSSHDHVCFSYEWIKAWWDAFGKGKQLLILAARDDDGRICAIAPLMRFRTFLFGLPVRKISFIYNNNASRADLIDGGFNREAAEGMAAYLRQNAHLWDMVELENIWDSSLTCKNLPDAMRHSNIRYSLKDGLHSPYVIVSGDWQSYFASRSKNFHKSYRNIWNRLKSRGDWSIINEPELDGIYNISRKSWKARCRKDIAADAENRDFFEILTDIAEKKGWLHLWILKVEGKGIAYEYALEYKNTMYAIKADFDETYRELSPGKMLHAYVMKYCFEHGLKEIDLCGHDEEYKKKWASGIRNHCHVTMYRPGLYGMILYILDHKIRYSLKESLKKIKALKTIKKNIERAKV
ncbi:MAG: GNAT family N-acetyltransferase [Candidatus Omnitrophica bacterium]|nr:GNAT family N-acetyltransferase [Candidatus Omnitrophota bacterium]